MAFDPLDVQANEKLQTTRKEKEQLISRQEAEDFKWLMSDKRGRRFIWSQLSLAGVFKTSFTGNSETFFNEGKRIMGLTLLTRIHELCPERYNQMVTEQQ